MNKKSLLALLMALLMLVLTGCASGPKPVVTVGNVSFTMAELEAAKAELANYYDQMGELYTAYYGYNPMAYTDSSLTGEALQNLGLTGVLLNKATEFGLDELTAEESVTLEENVTASWEAYRESAKSLLELAEDATEEEIEAAIDAKLAENNITLEQVRKVERNNLILGKVEAYVIKDVTVSDELVAETYNANVESEKAAYAADLSAYGAAVLNGETVCYAPAGYRYVKQILIQYNEEDAEKLNNINSAVYTAQYAVTTAEANVAGLLPEGTDLETLVAEVTVTLDEVTDPTTLTIKETTTNFTTELSEEAAAAVKTVAESRALSAAYEEQLKLAIEAAQAAIATEADEVVAAAKAEGADWDALVAAHNDDPGMMEGAANAATGYPVCAGFTSFDSAFVDAAMALTTVGEVSDKIPGETYGYYIIKYVGDVAEGAVALESVSEEIKSGLLTTAQDEAFANKQNEWFEEFRIVVDFEQLSF